MKISSKSITYLIKISLDHHQPMILIKIIVLPNTQKFTPGEETNF